MNNQAITTDLSALIDRYIAIWNETDPVARRTLIDTTWAEDATYTDPVLNGSGRDGIDAMIAGFQQAYARHTFEWSTQSLVEGESRFTWTLRTPEGDVGLKGEDTFVIANDGRLQSIVGDFQQP